VKTTIRPTKRAFALAGGALLLFGVGTNVQAGWVMAVAALLIGILAAGLILPLRGLNGIAVSRDVPRTAVAGDPIPVTVRISNSSKQSRSLFRATDDFLGRAVAVVRTIAPGETQSYEARRDGAKRGVYTEGACELDSAAPFGVLRIGRAVDIDSSVVVYPRTYAADAWMSRGPSGWAAPASVGDVSSVRDYRPGDPLRHIHWRSVARRGQLVVREFDRETQATTALIASVPDDPDVADAVASVACSIGLAGLREGEVALGSQRVRSADAILEWGARLAPGQGADTALDRADAVVYVGPASLAPVDHLAAIASSSPVTAVIVDREPAGDVITRLRGIGASVGVVAPDEVRTWFESGCAVS
jgi:uncharacterized protein (DUF58 family)